MAKQELLNKIESVSKELTETKLFLEDAQANSAKSTNLFNELSKEKDVLIEDKTQLELEVEKVIKYYIWRPPSLSE